MGYFDGAVKWVDVQLQQEWLGNPKGTLLRFKESFAQTLLKRGTAVLVTKEPDKSKTPEVKMTSDENVQDKMVKTAENKRIKRG